MTTDLSFVDLMTRLRSGDNEAASRIFHHFASLDFHGPLLP
jgi:hypothetical protein